MAIRLQGPPGSPFGPESTVGPNVDRINKAFDLVGERERIRRDRQQINDFVAATIRLQGENEGLTTEQITQLATKEVLEKGPQFSSGLAGVGQRFAGRFSGGPSTALTGPTAENLLSEPTGINRERIKAQIEANLALAKSRTVAKPGSDVVKPTPQQTQDTKDRKILKDDKASPADKQQAIDRISTSPDLVEPNTSQEEISETFQKIIDKIKDTRKRVGLDKRFSKESFDKGLIKAQSAAVQEGVNPQTIKRMFENWWDEQAVKEADQKFQKFELRSKFGGGFPASLNEALKSGKINEEELQDALDDIQNGTRTEEQIRKILEF